MLDVRPLPIPEPYDKHDPQPARSRRHPEPEYWTWDSWKAWIRQSYLRTWRKPQIRKALRMRDMDPCNANADFANVSSFWDKAGWIYALFHFPTGRWYVGQTIRRLYIRSQSQRKTSTDVLHMALRNDPNPFSFVVFPMEQISPQLYIKPGKQTRKATNDLFRKFATPREQNWVGTVGSMRLFQDVLLLDGCGESGAAPNLIV